MAGQRRPIATFVRHTVGVGTGLRQDTTHRSVHRHHHLQRFAVGLGANGNSQEVLHVQAAGRVPTAADDVHHRHR